MRTYKTEGIIIRRRNFGEADRILTVFTKHQGKIRIKALGVRKIISRRSSHIELLNHTFLSLYRGRSLPILTEAQTLSDFSKIKSDLKKIGFAYHICELVDGLCPENQENRLIFFLLEETLRRLSQDDNSLSLIRQFEIALLRHLGFYPRTKLSQNLNTHSFIENILERRLKSKAFILRLS